PDIMTFAKGVANGYPVGVTITTPEIASSIDHLTLSTYGGNPVAMATALATVEYIERHDRAGNAERQRARLRAHPDRHGARRALGRHPLGHARGAGDGGGDRAPGPGGHRPGPGRPPARAPRQARGAVRLRRRRARHGAHAGPGDGGARAGEAPRPGAGQRVR